MSLGTLLFNGIKSMKGYIQILGTSTTDIHIFITLSISTPI